MQSMGFRSDINFLRAIAVVLVVVDPVAVRQLFSCAALGQPAQAPLLERPLCVAKVEGSLADEIRERLFACWQRALECAG